MAPSGGMELVPARPRPGTGRWAWLPVAAAAGKPLPVAYLALLAVVSACSFPVLRELAAAYARAIHTWWSWRRSLARRLCIQISSPLDGTVSKLARPWGHYWGTRPWSRRPDAWQGFCPCCKRPLDLRLCEPWKPYPPKPWAVGRYAYVINLWGSSPAYVLGALVLGYSIKRTGSPHARVCLHTSDVPAHFLLLLAKVWDCRVVEHVESTWKLSVNEPRFEKVFTKLRGMSLTEFAKILVLDIDLLVRSNVDELFDLQPPAAMKRGLNQGRTPYKHGDTIDARCFFQGRASDASGWSWGVGTGINAGTMLWQPDNSVLKGMLEELCEPDHPSHICGAGPEQDYLSRFWADAPWSHIGVEYNFQIHHMFFAIAPDCAERAERAALLKTPEKVKIVHFSGAPDAKPWSRILDPKLSFGWPDRSRDGEYAERFAEEFLGYWLWVKRDRTSFERNQWNRDCAGMYIGPNGEIYRRPADALAGGAAEMLKVPEYASKGAMELLQTSLREWFDAFQELERELGVDLQQALTAKLDSRPQFWFASGAEAGKPAASGWVQWTSSAASHSSPKAPAAPAAASPVQEIVWDRTPGSWWVERAARGAAEMCSKAAAICGAPAGGQPFISFVEGGAETFEHRGSSSGIFLKVAGRGDARRFDVPPPDASKEAWAEAMAPVHAWVDAVEVGSALLLALLGVPPDAMPLVLAALHPLGVPAVRPPPETKAFAAVGYRPSAVASTSPASASRQATSTGAAQAVPGLWFATHASLDVAYAAMPWPQAVAAA